jgi:hypothetical protein
MKPRALYGYYGDSQLNTLIFLLHARIECIELTVTEMKKEG